MSNRLFSILWNRLTCGFSRQPVPRKIALCILALLFISYFCCLPKQLFSVPYSTVVADRNGELLGARIATDGQWRFPPRENVPEKFRQCLVVFEDKRFYRHWGVDPLALARAIAMNIEHKSIVSGGSTLTMQTIRLSRQKPRTFREKLVEMVLATRLEWRYSKDEILALYASHAPFGGNVVGLDAAAWRYFGHEADELSWAEAAMLAVLPNAPAIVHLSKGRETLLAKRNRLLKLLEERGVIDESTCELALTEPLPEKPLPLPSMAPHLVSRFYLSRNGKKTRTSIDKALQTQVENIAERWNRRFSQSNIRDMAILVIDIPNNTVAAYCGNVHFDRQQSGSQVDIIQSPRSTGSILKPLLFQAMFREGSLLPGMLIPDIPLNFNGFSPQNFNMRYEGAVPAADALARSLNVPAVVMLQRYGIAKFHRLLQQQGFRFINKSSSHYGLSLILGGAEATLWEVTNAYKNLALSITDKSPASLLASPPQAEAVRPQSLSAEEAGAAWLTLSALTEVNRPGGIDWKFLPSMQTVAWKTGTSYGFRDAWAVGITPRFVVGVWVGNATGEGKPELVGVQTAAPVMFDVFSILPASPWFQRPQGIFVEADICKQSGHLKGRFCPEAETRLILPAGLHSEPCPYHHPVTLSADGNWQVYEGDEEAGATRHVPWFTLPPAEEWFYKQHHPEYKSLPPFKKADGGSGHAPLQFIYPSTNARIRLAKQMDGRPGVMTAELAHSHPGETVYWHLDNNYVAQTQDLHKVSLRPDKGKHHLTAVDSKGNTASITFFIE